MATENNSVTNSSTISLASAMQRLMLDSELADLTVTCGDKEWKVHSTILAVRSSFFKAAITNNMAEKLNMKIHIQDYDPEAMEDVINFMYGVPKEKASIKFLFEAAERFQMDDLKEYVVKLARKGMTVANIAELGHLAEMYCCQGLLRECSKFIAKYDVPLKEEDMSPKLAIMVVKILKDANQKLKGKLENCEDDLRMSSSWREEEWSRLHDIQLNGQVLEYVGQEEYGYVGSGQAKKPLSTIRHYFEIEIIEPGSSCSIAIGLASKDYYMDELPGWSKGSIGYHADDGNVYMGSGTGDPFGPVCNKGDIIGCGVIFPRGFPREQEVDKAIVKMMESDFKSPVDYETYFEQDEDGWWVKEEVNTYHGHNVHVYFSRNGKIIGMKEVELPRGGFFPFVGMMSCGEKVRVDLKPNCNPVSI